MTISIFAFLVGSFFMGSSLSRPFSVIGVITLIFSIALITTGIFLS